MRNRHKSPSHPPSISSYNASQLSYTPFKANTNSPHYLTHASHSSFFLSTPHSFINCQHALPLLSLPIPYEWSTIDNSIERFLYPANPSTLVGWIHSTRIVIVRLLLTDGNTLCWWVHRRWLRSFLLPNRQDGHVDYNPLWTPSLDCNNDCLWRGIRWSERGLTMVSRDNWSTHRCHIHSQP